jgi:Protein of unknown function (DUF3618)
MASQTEQFEREAEETRWQLSGTLEELRSWMTPGRVVDQLLDYTKDGPAGEFLQNLGRQVRENPMPVVLIGIGIAWLVVASNRTSRAAIASAADSVARRASDLGNSASAAINRTSQWGQETATRLSDRAAVVSNKTAEFAARAREMTGLADRPRERSDAAAAERSLERAPEVTQSSEQPVATERGKSPSPENAYALETAHESR